MSLYLGKNKMSAAYYGSAPIQKIYYGSKLIYANEVTLSLTFSPQAQTYFENTNAIILRITAGNQVYYYTGKDIQTTITIACKYGDQVNITKTAAGELLYFYKTQFNITTPTTVNISLQDKYIIAPYPLDTVDIQYTFNDNTNSYIVNGFLSDGSNKLLSQTEYFLYGSMEVFITGSIPDDPESEGGGGSGSGTYAAYSSDIGYHYDAKTLNNKKQFTFDTEIEKEDYYFEDSGWSYEGTIYVASIQTLTAQTGSITIERETDTGDSIKYAFPIINGFETNGLYTYFVVINEDNRQFYNQNKNTAISPTVYD